MEAAVAACETAQKEEEEAQGQLVALEAEVALKRQPCRARGWPRRRRPRPPFGPGEHAPGQVPDRLVDHKQAINAPLRACPASLSGSTSTSPGVLGSESSDEETVDQDRGPPCDSSMMQPVTSSASCSYTEVIDLVGHCDELNDAVIAARVHSVRQRRCGHA